MAIDPANANPPTNQLSFQDIIDEFGENSTKSLGGYRMNNLNVGGFTEVSLDGDGCGISGNGSIPVDNQPIKFSDFYNSRLNVLVDCYTSNQNRVVAKTKYTANVQPGNYRIIGPKGGDNSNTSETPPSNTSGKKIIITVNKQIGSVNANNDKTKCALRTGNWNSGTDLRINVRSNGFISGAGGHGGSGGTGNSNGFGGKNGTSAIGVTYSGTKIIAVSGAKIRKGYGGGGGGGSAYGQTEESYKPYIYGQGSGGGGGAGIPFGEGGDESDANPGIHANGIDGNDGTATSGGAQSPRGPYVYFGGENGVPTRARGGTGGRGADSEQTATTGGTGDANGEEWQRGPYNLGGGAPGTDGHWLVRPSGTSVDTSQIAAGVVQGDVSNQNPT